MALLMIETQNVRKMSFVVFILCVLISLKNQNAEINKGFYSSWDFSASIFLAPLTSSRSSSSSSPLEDDKLLVMEDDGDLFRSLEYDFYRDSCPQAEKIVRRVVRHFYSYMPNVAPALLRLVFHDCFIEGCDASILLDADEVLGSEKDSPPNESLKGFDVIDTIKSEVENVCPGVVSCADIVVLAAREGVLLAGGPFYPLHTGRRDSIHSFRDKAAYELPSPQADIFETLDSFASRGFDGRETVSLLGAHSIGMIHCKFFQNRLYNFGGTNKPDPSVNAEFLIQMRSRCNISNIPTTPTVSPSFHFSSSPPLIPPASFDGQVQSAPSASFDSPMSSVAAPSHITDGSFSSSPLSASSMSSSTAPSPVFSRAQSSFIEKQGRKGSLSPSETPSPSFKSSTSSSPLASFNFSPASLPTEQAINMAYEGPGIDFGTLYYRSILQGKGILYADQQLMADEETGMWVRAYASDASLFRRDFSLAMMKLSNLQVLTGSMGQVRRSCSKLA